MHIHNQLLQIIVLAHNKTLRLLSDNRCYFSLLFFSFACQKLIQYLHWDTGESEALFTQIIRRKHFVILSNNYGRYLLVALFLLNIRVESTVTRKLSDFLLLSIVFFQHRFIKGQLVLKNVLIYNDFIFKAFKSRQIQSTY